MDKSYLNGIDFCYEVLYKGMTIERLLNRILSIKNDFTYLDDAFCNI